MTLFPDNCCSFPVQVDTPSCVPSPSLVFCFVYLGTRVPFDGPPSFICHIRRTSQPLPQGVLGIPLSLYTVLNINKKNKLPLSVHIALCCMWHVTNVEFQSITLQIDTGPAANLSIRLSKHAEEDGFSGGEGIPLRRQESSRLP